MIIYFTIANNKYKYPMNNEKVDVRKYQYIKDCEAGAGRTPSFRKRKYFSAFLKGMTGALDNPFLITF